MFKPLISVLCNVLAETLCFGGFCVSHKFSRIQASSVLLEFLILFNHQLSFLVQRCFWPRVVKSVFLSRQIDLLAFLSFEEIFLQESVNLLPCQDYYIFCTELDLLGKIMFISFSRF